MCNAMRYIAILLVSTLPMYVYSEPHEYKATYSFTLKGVEFANSEHESVYDKENDEWCIKTISYTVSIFSLKEDTRTESSCFYYDKTNDTKIAAVSVSNGFLQFKRYNYERIRSKKHELVVTKMVDNRFESTFNEEFIKYDTNSKLDRLTAQMFGYSLGEMNISDKGRERKYIFQHMGDNKIKTIFGDTNVRIIKKNILDNKRSSLTWYAIDKNYIPVMIEQYRLDKLMFRATLKSYKK